MPTHGKKYRGKVEGVDLSQRFSVEDAVSKSLAASYAKFDETVDVALKLGVDPKYSDQMVRGAVSLPHGLGKTVRVAVFCKGDKQAEARAAGADAVGAEELVEQVKGGWLDFDAAVATPDVMALVGQIGRVLGPRGLMPNAKTGTVTFDVANAVKELKAGRVDFKVDKAGVLHAPLGKVSFGPEPFLMRASSNVLLSKISVGQILCSGVATSVSPCSTEVEHFNGELLHDIQKKQN